MFSSVSAGSNFVTNFVKKFTIHFKAAYKVLLPLISNENAF